MLSESEKKSLKQCEEQLAKPKWKYVLLYGVIGWGLPTGIIVTFINKAVDKKSWSEITLSDILINLIGFLIGGIIFGLVTRNFLQKRYNKLKKKEQSAV